MGDLAYISLYKTSEPHCLKSYSIPNPHSTKHLEKIVNTISESLQNRLVCLLYKITK